MKKTIVITIALLLLAMTLTGCGPNLDEFAKCTAESGMTSYGTYWCPHCANIKKSFGSSFQYVNYVECDDNGPNGNELKCAEDGIKAYPSFIFGDNMMIQGEMPLEAIAEKTGCDLP